MTTTLVCPDCHKNNTWTNNAYKQGLFFNCKSCSTRLQQIFCPHCSSSNIWSNPTPSIEGRSIRCGKCSKSFQYIYCPSCKGINMWSTGNCNQAQVYNCRMCIQSFQRVNCAHCSAANVYSTTQSIHGEHLRCGSCTKVYQYIRCPNCHKGQVWKNCDYKAGSVVPCISCKQNYAHMRCPHCYRSNFWKNPLNTTITFVCYSCNKDMCTKITRETSQTKQKVDLKSNRPRPSAFQNPIRRTTSQTNLDRPRGRSSSVVRDVATRHSARAASSHTSETLSCNYFTECKEYVKQLHWAPSFFDNKHDHCYCQNCYPNHLSDTLRVANADYVVPRNWAGFGLGVDPFRDDNIWNTWIVVYHGTTSIAAQSILDHRQFLLPGDHLIDGTRLAIRSGHIPGKVHVYTSPSIRYSSLEVYSPKKSFISPKTGKHYNAQIVFQCKQKPGTFLTQSETVGWGNRPICNFIPNERIEHYSDRRSSIIPYRLLIHLENA